jgi:hypothetical protein
VARRLPHIDILIYEAIKKGCSDIKPVTVEVKEPHHSQEGAYRSHPCCGCERLIKVDTFDLPEALSYETSFISL